MNKLTFSILGLCLVATSATAMEQNNLTRAIRITYGDESGYTTVPVQNNYVEAPAYYAQPAEYVQPARTPSYNRSGGMENYVSVRAEITLASWTNTYMSDYVGMSEDEEFSMESMFGGSLAFGKRFENGWRGEIEAGYTGQFTDADAGFTFKMSAPYITANGMYDMTSGLYLGGGLGLAMPSVTLDGAIFDAGNRTKSSVSPMLAGMLGFSQRLDERLILDFRYRLSGFWGPTLTRTFKAANVPYYLETKVGMVLDNSFSVALRYEF